MIELPTIYHRTGVYLMRGDPTLELRKADRKMVEEDRDRYRERLVKDNEHLAEGDGAELHGVIVLMAVHLDSAIPPEYCSEVGTIPIDPRPLMWLGSFPLQTLPRTN